MALSVKMLKRGKRLTPYVSYSHENGRVQRAFAEQIGRPAGQCVVGAVRKGMAQTEIRAAVANCGKQFRGVRLNLGAAAR